MDQGSAAVRSQILATVREFVRREVAPRAAEHDPRGYLPSRARGADEEVGTLCITVPEEYGGLGLDYTTFAMIFEELAKGWMSITGVLGTHSILTYVIGRVWV